MHVDAAWGGGLAFSDAQAQSLRGIEGADSITFCPRKLLLIALSNSVTLFRDGATMNAAFRTEFPYLDTGDEQFVNRPEIQVQGSRPAEILCDFLSALPRYRREAEPGTLRPSCGQQHRHNGDGYARGANGNAYCAIATT